MKVKELKRLIDVQLQSTPEMGEYDIKVLVRNKRSTVGARPSAVIINATFGFDFESGLIFMTKEPIQIITK